MKTFLIFTLVFFAMNSTVKPNEQRDHRIGESDSKLASYIEIMNGQTNSSITDNRRQETPKWYATVEWANWFLFAAGVWTGIAVWKQAKESTKATVAMKENIDLQKAAMEQWVDIETRSASVMGTGQDRDIGFHFQCINNTEQPLTIKKIVTEVGFLANEWHKSTVETDTTLAPYQKGKAKYFFYAVLKGAKDRIEEFEKGSAIYTINGEVSYIDCLRRNRTQGFHGLYRASADVFECLEPYGTVPTYEKRMEDISRWNTLLHNKKTDENT